MFCRFGSKGKKPSNPIRSYKKDRISLNRCRCEQTQQRETHRAQPTTMSSVSYEVPHTSDIPFFSSLHGRAQREMRGIERRDLQGELYFLSAFFGPVKSTKVQHVNQVKVESMPPTAVKVKSFQRVFELQICCRQRVRSASPLPSSWCCVACTWGEVGGARVAAVVRPLVGLSSCCFADLRAKQVQYTESTHRRTDDVVCLQNLDVQTLLWDQ